MWSVGIGDSWGGAGENKGGTGNEYCNTGDNIGGIGNNYEGTDDNYGSTGDNNDTGDNNNNTGNNISDTGNNNSVTDDSNSDTGYDSRCGASDSGDGAGSDVFQSHCCNHKIYGVYEAATSSPGQYPGPACVPHKTRQAGYHEILPIQRAVSDKIKYRPFVTIYQITISTF